MSDIQFTYVLSEDVSTHEDSCADYPDWDVCGVFSSLEKAQEYAASYWKRSFRWVQMLDEDNTGKTWWADRLTIECFLMDESHGQ